jgi:hypothetical protein
MEFDTASTTITGGVVIESGYVPATGANRAVGSIISQTSNRLPLALEIDGTHPTTPLTDVMSIVVTSVGGASDVGSQMSWKEI